MSVGNPGQLQDVQESGYRDYGGARATDAHLNGWWMFAGLMLGLAGTLDVIWGIAAVSGSKFFVAGQRYIISDLHTWGWVTLILGCVELIAALSLFAGGSFGRWIGIIVAAIVAVVSLVTIPAYPLWGVCVFTLCLLTIFGLFKPAVVDA